MTVLVNVLVIGVAAFAVWEWLLEEPEPTPDIDRPPAPVYIPMMEPLSAE